LRILNNSQALPIRKAFARIESRQVWRRRRTISRHSAPQHVPSVQGRDRLRMLCATARDAVFAVRGYRFTQQWPACADMHRQRIDRREGSYRIRSLHGLRAGRIRIAAFDSVDGTGHSHNRSSTNYSRRTNSAPEQICARELRSRLRRSSFSHSVWNACDQASQNRFDPEGFRWTAVDRTPPRR